jgi:hypothetical protein
MKSVTVGTKSINSRTFEEREQELKEIDEAEKRRLKQEKSTPYKRWAQYNLERTPAMIELALKSPKSYVILLFLVDQMDSHNAVVCSYQAIQELFEISHATVARSINILKTGGYLTVLKTGNSNVYVINDTVYWKSWGNNKRYSKFPANIVLSMSEQEKEYQIQHPIENEKNNAESVSFKERYNRVLSEKIKTITIEDFLPKD